LNLPSATAISSVGVSNNTFNVPGAAGIGIGVTKGAGVSNIDVTNNIMTFAGVGARGVRMNLGANSTVSVSNNQITMNGDLSEAVLFPLVQGISTLTIEGNTITIDDGPDLIVDERGIHIQAITGAVTLFGNVNNDIQIYGFRGRGIPYIQVPNTILGTTLINGTRQP